MGKPAKELLELSLAQAAHLVKSREISPVDLVGVSLDRIEAVDGRLSAYISVFEDEAREVAIAAETMIMAAHDLGPLHGHTDRVEGQPRGQGIQDDCGEQGSQGAAR